MDFVKVSATLLQDFESKNIRYAVIGGFALGFWGVTRATVDMDFLLLLDDADKATRILSDHGYQQTFHTENVARYQSPDSSFGTIDIIYAFREVSRNMLARSVQVTLSEDLSLTSLLPEDIIGLKVQAIANDVTRRDRDLADIRGLLAAKRDRADAIDWSLLNQYFSLFEFEGLFAELEQDYGHS